MFVKLKLTSFTKYTTSCKEIYLPIYLFIHLFFKKIWESAEYCRLQFWQDLRNSFKIMN